MIRIFFFAALVGLSVLVVSGCWEPASDSLTFSRFIGSYKADFGSAQVDEIEFRRDTTYIHWFQMPGRPLEADTGRYEFVEMTRPFTYCVSMERFILFGEKRLCVSFQATGVDGRRYVNACLVVKRFGDKQYVYLCPDELLRYVKFK